MNRPKRSLFTICLLVLTMIAVVTAGCSSTGTTPSASGTPGSTGTPAPAADTVREITHAMGKTEIKGTPQRVVILTNEGTEALLELGVKPVGAVKSGVGNTWYPHIKEAMQGVTELGEEVQPNLELIVSLKPDLIIGNKVRHEKIYDQLTKIAPTVFAEDLSGKWKKNFALYAEALNKKAEGDKAMDSYNKHVADVKGKFGDKTSAKVSIVRFLPNAVRIYQKDTFAGIILQDLGFARPAAQDKNAFMEVITKERMADMDGDIMFYFNSDYDDSKGGTKSQQEWMKDPLYTNLNVAKNNKAFQIDEIIWNTSGGIKSANLMLDDFVKYADKL
ncbi:ABC transporter substrate-binding protein [Paenibacillus sp. FJAT-26967]|uniref:ABC transporter substrate-binding protein n=1 Tax=Paenibacillus sp. FJAT-26967 TaxID=1729690 RepID=UPI0008386B0A|nr:iron-siderophore ABC transporter substrate-binding protein [Paenibacillus sp. FJAT-26967]